MVNKYLLPYFVFINLIFTQLQYSGQFKLSYSSFLNSPKLLSKPFRIIKFDCYYTFANIDLISRNALEYNWQTKEYKYDLREFYLSWYPTFGEIRIGKQIIPLGMADGNNPSDNVNPYNYNYLFLSGIERKIGVNSLYSDIYLGDYQLNIILKLDNSKNIFPREDDDSIFPIINTTKSNQELEYGFSIKMMLSENDISLSYYKGRDYLPIDNGNNLEYRKTNVIGLNTVGFINQFTYRLEGAYFISTSTNNNYSGNYIQYTNQIEYEIDNNTIIMCQYIGQEIIDKKYNDFMITMGNPMHSIFDNSLLLSLQKTILDERLDLSLNSIINLDNKLHSLNVSIDYELINNCNLYFKLSKSVSNESDNSFYNAIEKFSQATIEFNLYY